MSSKKFTRTQNLIELFIDEEFCFTKKKEYKVFVGRNDRIVQKKTR